MRLVLGYIFLMVFFCACKRGRTGEPETQSSLYPPPATYSLDTTKGYTRNPFSGDSVLPFKNTQGQIVPSGRTIPIVVNEYNAAREIKPQVINIGALRNKTTGNNFRVITDKQVTLRVDTFYVDRSEVEPIVTPATTKFQKVLKTEAVKAQPFGYKDDAGENIQYLDVEQGLGSSSVYAVLEDRKGNLWMATDGSGVTRYDGVHFYYYTVKEGLASNSVYSLMEDRLGNIWISSTNGLNKLDGSNLVSYPNSPAAYKTNSTFEDKQGNIWISSIKGLTKYDGKNFYQYTSRNGLPTETVQGCIEDKSGNIWVFTTRGACRFDGKRFLNLLVTDDGGQYYPKSILQDRKNNIWFGTNRGLIKSDNKKYTLFYGNESFSPTYIWALFQDRKENIWISTYDGIFRLSGNTSVQYSLKEGVTNKRVRGAFEDKSGNIWFGTDGGGLNKLTPDGFGYPISTDLLEKSKVRPLVASKNGAIWFGTERGPFGNFTVPQSKRKPMELNRCDPQKSFRWAGQRSLLQDSNGDLWFGTTENGLMRYSGGVFTTLLPFVENSLETIYALLQDKKGNIWFSSETRGLFKYDGARLFHYALPGYTVFSIIEDSSGSMWLGTNGGGLMKLADSTVVVYGAKEGLFAKQITSMIIDRYGKLWLGTQDRGVCVFDGKGFTYYTSLTGLSNNNVWSIAEDNAHDIWVGTDKGLNRFVQEPLSQDPVKQGYQILNYGREDGIQSTDFSLNGVCVDHEGRIWWGTGKGILSKEPHAPDSLQQIQSLTVNDIEINNQEYDYRDFPDSLKSVIRYDSVLTFTNCPDHLTLSHRNNSLRFQFSAIDWSAPHKIRYAYRMIGLNNQWTTPSDEAFADYRNLNPGDYEFQVMAVGQSQKWTEPLSYRFTIKPAWWQTWWFQTITYLFAALLVLFITRLVYLSRLRKQRASLEKQMAIQLERQRISAEMHDDIGAGLSGVRLLTEMTKSKLKDSGATNEIDKIYESVGDISAKMKEVIWSLNAENDSLAGLISYLQAQTRQMLEHYPGKLVVTIPDNIPEYSMHGETRRHIYLALKEALNNIIKHSGASLVTLNISCGQFLIIELTDNGRGILADNVNNGGNGLKNMEKRLKDVGGSFTVKNDGGLGLTFKIPLV